MKKRVDWRRVGIATLTLVLIFSAFTIVMLWTTGNVHFSILMALCYILLAVVIAFMVNIHRLSSELREIKDFYYHTPEDKK